MDTLLAIRFIWNSRIINGGLKIVTFQNLVGNKEIKKLLNEIIQSKNFLHSYLFTGREGIGKMLFAKEFAKQALCLGEPNCKSCIEFDSQNNPDFIIIEPDGNSIKIEQIRLLQMKIIEKPIISHRKIYIIRDSEKMTKEAQNCLLKTLEEPPEYIIIILLCSNESLLLNTIQSRCTKINFQPISDEELKLFLEKEGLTNITNNMLKTMDGIIAKAYELQEFKEIYKIIEDTLIKRRQLSKIHFLNSFLPIYKEKDNINAILEYMNVVLFHEAKKDVKCLDCIEKVEIAKNRIKQNANLDMTLDNMIFSIWEIANKSTLN